MNFSFSDWKILAKEDPNAFECLRVKLINKTIAKTDPDVRRKLNGLQFRIDVTLGHNPCKKFHESELPTDFNRITKPPKLRQLCNLNNFYLDHTFPQHLVSDI